ncbi:MAG: CinA family protein [Marinilabiliales bacterium]|nr:CinA family protein [Marinilabiliales bacterium]
MLSARDGSCDGQGSTEAYGDRLFRCGDGHCRTGTEARPEKPVGTVWIAMDSDRGVVTEKHNFADNRIINISRSAYTLPLTCLENR